MELKTSYRVSINLLPSKYRAKKTPNWVRLLFMVILLGVTAFYVYSYISVDMKIEMLQSGIETLNIELTYLREKEREMQELERQITSIENRIDILKALIQGEVDWLQVIEAMADCMPPDLFLEQAFFYPEAIRMNGNSVSIFSIAQFIDSLSYYPDLFTGAHFNSLNLDDGLYAFNLSLGVNTQ